VIRSVDQDGLTAGARAVLDGNWLGGATKPAPHLYPHQWSWDSAFIAIGNRHDRWDRADLEMRTLFDAQWPNGMVPHIVFGDTSTDYFPSPAFWNVQGVAAPRPPTPSSGICQPAVHATAVRLISESAPDPGDGRQLLDDLYPKLAAWHDYLLSTRAIDGALVEIWHPWESGMDNSPVWDDLFASLEFAPEDVPEYRRIDTSHADADDRPSDAEYDRYAFLVGQLRDRGYQPKNARELPFRVRDVLFNSALARAEEDLAVIAERVGADPARHRERAGVIAAAIDDHLWDEERGWYFSQDATNDELINSRVCGGLMPLITGRPSGERLARLMATFGDEFAVDLPGGALAMLSTARDDRGFDPIRYWRGPVWIQMTWLAADGLDRVREHDRADRLRAGVLQLVDRVGWYEYFDPVAFTGHGADDFSWTAALTLDLLARLS